MTPASIRKKRLFVIELLRDCADEHSVCHSQEAFGIDLPTAMLQASGLRDEAKTQGAVAYQIRDLGKGGRVAAIKHFSAL